MVLHISESIAGELPGFLPPSEADPTAYPKRVRV